jgi:hypothetical protein
MNFVAGALLLVLTGGGRQQQQPHCNSAAAAAASMQSSGASNAGRPTRISSSSGSSSGCTDDPAAAAAAAGLEGPESLAFGCLLAIAEHVLPGYYSPAMVAPQVKSFGYRLVFARWRLLPRTSERACLFATA